MQMHDNDNRSRAEQHADERAAEIQYALDNGATPASLGWPHLTPDQVVQAEWRAWHEEEQRLAAAQSSDWQPI